MENKRSSLLIVFLVIAIILIGVIGVLLYLQKTEANRQIAELTDTAIKLQNNINDLQGKIDSISNTINSDKISEVDNNISNTTNEVKYDVEIKMSELEGVDYTDITQLKAVRDKYKGKNVKITGYVSNFGEDDIEPGRIYVNIGNDTTYKNNIYAGGMTTNSDVKEQISQLKKGQKISIIGVAFKEGTMEEEGYWPIILNETKIIEE